MSNKLSKLSLTLFTVRSSPDPYVVKLKKLREIGYQSIQGGFVEGMTPQEHKDLLDSLGMEISAWGGGAERVEQNLREYADACHLFDVNTIMTGTVPTELRSTYDGFMKSIEYMNSVGRQIAKEGIVLGYHNHAQEFRRFSNGKTGMDLLFENLDPTCVHFLYDVHWLQAGGADVIQWLEKSKGRMRHLHVKDYRIAPINFDTIVETHDKQFSQIGDGNMPWQLIVDTGLACGIESFIVEQDNTYGQDCYECAAQSYATLKACGL